MLFEISCFKETQHMFLAHFGKISSERCIEGIIMTHKQWQRKLKRKKETAKKKTPQNTEMYGDFFLRFCYDFMLCLCTNTMMDTHLCCFQYNYHNKMYILHLCL